MATAREAVGGFALSVAAFGSVGPPDCADAGFSRGRSTSFVGIVAVEADEGWSALGVIVAEGETGRFGVREADSATATSLLLADP